MHTECQIKMNVGNLIALPFSFMNFDWSSSHSLSRLSTWPHQKLIVERRPLLTSNVFECSNFKFTVDSRCCSLSSHLSLRFQIGRTTNCHSLWPASHVWDTPSGRLDKPVFILSKHLKIEVKTEVNVLIFRFFFLAQHSTHQSGYYRLSRHTLTFYSTS